MKQEFKRADKNRPREMSSKIKVPAYEKVKQVSFTSIYFWDTYHLFYQQGYKYHSFSSPFFGS